MGILGLDSSQTLFDSTVSPKISSTLLSNLTGIHQITHSDTLCDTQGQRGMNILCSYSINSKRRVTLKNKILLIMMAGLLLISFGRVWSRNSYTRTQATFQPWGAGEELI